MINEMDVIALLHQVNEIVSHRETNVLPLFVIRDLCREYLSNFKYHQSSYVNIIEGNESGAI